MKSLTVILNVGFQNDYLQVCLLCIQTLKLWHPEATVVLVADEKFKAQLERSQLGIDFIFQPDCKTLTSILRRKCDLYELCKPFIEMSELCVYLDADTVVLRDFSEWLSLIRAAPSGTLHAAAEGHVGDPWCTPASFTPLPFVQTSTFNNGVMGFKPHSEIESLFAEAGKLMDEFPRETGDQVFFNTIALQRGCVHITLQKDWILSSARYKPQDLQHNHVFAHANGLGDSARQKFAALVLILQQQEAKVKLGEECFRQASKVVIATETIVKERLLPVVAESKEHLEGNIFFTHDGSEAPQFAAKRLNLAVQAAKHSSEKILEIGFNAGFSATLLLEANPNAHLTCIDICTHTYTKPCFRVLESLYPGRVTLLEGSSPDILAAIEEKFDLIHIDGAHDTEIAEKDILHSIRLSKPGTILVMDDTNMANLRKLWDSATQTHGLAEVVDALETTYHSVKQMIK